MMETHKELWIDGGGVRFVYTDEYVEHLEKLVATKDGGLQAAIAALEFRKQHLMRDISDAVYEDRMEAAIEKLKDVLAAK